ncbi:uncharacterized protein LOC588301 isoform X2 [Strongylocentrotus purpuratus]|uniref:Uncharacterized protein n=1 Tax=Strongylocentrotus purpuratus TaxID=7668 RepID=A0A7M7HLU9_STRPU|nr:uncharacterized protein LOC588301 isoform X2 [Strongylocentrotus purpuratus]|eukprot:XP_011676490.1 PREDICTED: uncharacterized protein LOC588301 [Strongylocentrotus purpuratus]
MQISQRDPFMQFSLLWRRAESSRHIRLRSALSTVVPLRRLKACDARFLDAATDHMLLGGIAQKDDSFAELWPFLESEKKAFYNHRIAMLMRKGRKGREKCFSQVSGLECGMPLQFCSLNLLGSGWKVRRRVVQAFEDTTKGTNAAIKIGGIKNSELRCSLQELLRPGLIRDFSQEAEPICLRTPINMIPKDLEIVKDLFFRVLGYTCILPFNVASHVSDNARAETCLIIESYVHHTVITPIVDGILCSDLVRCKPIGFAHVLDYLVLSLVVKNPNLSKIRAPSLMLNTNPERMTLALSPARDLMAAVRPENPSEYAYNSQLGVLQSGTALQLKESILCVFQGIDSCKRSEFLVLLATEYMYKCLDLVSMVTELLSQFDLLNVRRLVSRIFFVGENTRIGSFRERFERDLRVSLDRLGAVFGGEFARQQRWPIHCVHAEVEDRPNCLFSDTFTTMDYIFQGPDFF